MIFSEAHGTDFDLIVCGTPGSKSAHRFPGEHVNCKHDPEGADGNPFAAMICAPIPEPEWACGECGYHNSGPVCTHCGRPLVVTGSSPSGDPS